MLEGTARRRSWRPCSAGYRGIPPRVGEAARARAQRGRGRRVARRDPARSRWPADARHVALTPLEGGAATPTSSARTGCSRPRARAQCPFPAGRGAGRGRSRHGGAPAARRAGGLRRVLGEILVGSTGPGTSAASSVRGPDADARTPRRTGRRAQDPGQTRGRPRGPDRRQARPSAKVPVEPAGDHVDRLLALVRDALSGTEGRRLVRLDEDRWWLGDRADRDTAAVPLADRVEWAVYSLLSTAGPLSEAQFLDRITGLFTARTSPTSRSSAPASTLPEPGLDARSPVHHRRRGQAQPRARGADRPPRGPGPPPGVRLLDRGAPAVATLPRRAARRPPGRPGAGRPAVPRSRAGRGLEGRGRDLYVRGRAVPVEIEWTAMLGRHRAAAARAIPPGRAPGAVLVGCRSERSSPAKLERSPALRAELETGRWHLLRPTTCVMGGPRGRGVADLERCSASTRSVERTGDQLSCSTRMPRAVRPRRHGRVRPARRG